ncbi:hypothetical protein EON65_43465 [archaeon]|nr:MAG: hypothetical protein EON65_43465 [archaeon]
MVTAFHNRSLTPAPPSWEDLQCCIPRQHCTERHDWQHVSNASAVPILSLYGIPVPLGNSNFHAETYRYCTLATSTDLHVCP